MIHYEGHGVTVHAGDCLDVLRDLPDASVDSVVTDPPYGLEFMGKDWDAPWQKRVGTGGHNAGFSDTGFTDGFQRLPRPSHTGGTNPGCLNCGGKKHGHDPKQRKVCTCEQPNYQNVTLPRMHAFQAWCEQWATECFRVLKPGGHILAFGGTRTSHRLTCAIEDAGFEIRDSIPWLYGSGFPKSRNVSKDIDRLAGVEPLVVSEGASVRRMIPGADQNATGSWIKDNGREYTPTTTEPVTEAARQWRGWGTAMKPAHEPIVKARKPLTGTVAATVLQYGTGAINIDGCRIGDTPSGGGGRSNGIYGHAGDGTPQPQYTGAYESQPTTGRWPANVVLTHSDACGPTVCAPGCPVAELDQQSGETRSAGGAGDASGKPAQNVYGEYAGTVKGAHAGGLGDSGGASRFFPVFRYEPKAATAERIRLPKEGATDHRAGNNFAGGIRVCNVCANRTKPGNWVPGDTRPWPGCGHNDWEWGVPNEQGGSIAHPTTKPLDLMCWLVRLVTPPGGLVLDPFAGSGTTAEACIIEGFRCITIEREADYLPMIVQRINRRRDPVAATRAAPTGEPTLFDLTPEPTPPADTRAGEPSADRRYTTQGGTNFAMKPGQRRRD